MKTTSDLQWNRFKRFYTTFPALGLSVDLSRMNFPDSFLDQMQAPLERASAQMAELEAGAIANSDENRMVGHYWLRAPKLAPTPEITSQIERAWERIAQFSAQVHQGEIRGQAGPFRNLLIVGIGGSALGPQFLARALGHPLKDRMRILFLDNTDPDGFDTTFSTMADEAGVTLCLVISKSGGTKETRNGMLEAQAFFKMKGFPFSRHAIAITGSGSELDSLAEAEGWLARFPMWDWVGGRTSVTSAVGLLPLTLQGIAAQQFIDGARACDEQTRSSAFASNPAAQLALIWYYTGGGCGRKDMVVLPYKDRLELFSRYLQQLVMESLGKEFDLEGNRVEQGLSVFGNKGSTDQHAYVQQLRDGLPNFFVNFIEVLRDRDGDSLFVEPKVTSGDYLRSFLLGTREALFEKGRESITLTLREVSPFTVGVLIALFERAVGLYASLIRINAYHQPGVEAGKQAAGKLLQLQRGILEHLRARQGREHSVEELASATGGTPEAVFKILEHLSANSTRGILRTGGMSPHEALYAHEV